MSQGFFYINLRFALWSELVVSGDPFCVFQDLCIKRKRNLTFLVHFMKEATEELLWMSQKEETEVSRDWSDSDLQLEEIEEYRKASSCIFV